MREKRRDPFTRDAEEKLSRHLQTRARIVRRRRGGRIELAFSSEEELIGLFERLGTREARSKSLKPEGSTLNGFLDKGSHFHGELDFEETFRIDGKFEGKIRSGSELILGDTAEVTGEIDVGRLSVNGVLKGHGARDGAHRAARARARRGGYSSTPVLKIEEGARLRRRRAGWGRMRSNVIDLPSSPRK